MRRRALAVGRAAVAVPLMLAVVASATGWLYAIGPRATLPGPRHRRRTAARRAVEACVGAAARVPRRLGGRRGSPRAARALRACRAPDRRAAARARRRRLGLPRHRRLDPRHPADPGGRGVPRGVAAARRLPRSGARRSRRRAARPCARRHPLALAAAARGVRRRRGWARRARRDPARAPDLAARAARPGGGPPAGRRPRGSDRRRADAARARTRTAQAARLAPRRRAAARLDDAAHLPRDGLRRDGDRAARDRARRPPAGLLGRRRSHLAAAGAASGRPPRRRDLRLRSGRPLGEPARRRPAVHAPVLAVRDEPRPRRASRSSTAAGT